ncbi:ComF family protein [Saccharibacter sp. 17.LH.SD]|uniref:ComF family protein n=1 Tax=Saccharibacter sp. 17.LH.SD TaxID=2689393 RepID=UPI00136E27C8|nr:ComF family protein [Saccharibacter sp. 17.LH.SD]MXV44581.1 ComF family protein [Saccharibacter sp. 17.LH.SD]
MSVVLFWKKAVLGIGKRMLDFVCPPTCLSCGADIMAGGVLCSSCFASLRFIAKPFCARCGEPFALPALGFGTGVCARCREVPPLWGRACAALIYDDAARRLIFPLKYADRSSYARRLAQFMVRAGRDILNEPSYLIPVPLHRQKLRQRRYNQAALLARCIGKESGMPVIIDGLLRQRHTRPLAHLTIAERRDELHDVFQVKELYSDVLRGKKIVLIDDILTTGATAEACTRALLAVGCQSVDVLVMARACAGDVDIAVGYMYAKD